MYLGTKYEEERRIREKRKKEGSRLSGRCYVTRQISTLILVELLSNRYFGSVSVGIFSVSSQPILDENSVHKTISVWSYIIFM
jgi:hypothetical protein